MKSLAAQDVENEINMNRNRPLPMSAELAQMVPFFVQLRIFFQGLPEPADPPRLSSVCQRQPAHTLPARLTLALFS